MDRADLIIEFQWVPSESSKGSVLCFKVALPFVTISASRLDIRLIVDTLVITVSWMPRVIFSPIFLLTGWVEMR